MVVCWDVCVCMRVLVCVVLLIVYLQDKHLLFSVCYGCALKLFEYIYFQTHQSTLNESFLGTVVSLSTPLDLSTVTQHSSDAFAIQRLCTCTQQVRG